MTDPLPPKEDLVATIIWSLRQVLGVVKDTLSIVVLAAVIYYGYGIIHAMHEVSNKLDQLGFN